jgi:hypothetical protein
MRLKEENGGCYASKGIAFAVSRALWREIFPGNTGFGARGQNIADIELPSSRPAADREHAAG